MYAYPPTHPYLDVTHTIITTTTQNQLTFEEEVDRQPSHAQVSGDLRHDAFEKASPRCIDNKVAYSWKCDL